MTDHAAERRKKQRHQVAFDAIKAAVGLGPRLYLRSIEDRLAAAIMNVHNDYDASR